MITRRHGAGDTLSEAVYSECGAYRYGLTRVWGEGAQVMFVMLNPSTATELRNDPTIARCERRARALGFAGVRIGNLFGLRATDPKALPRALDPVGPGNDAILVETAVGAATMICAWGNHGLLLGRSHQVEGLLRAGGATLAHLGLTRLAQPRHPLYVRQDQPLLMW